ncbi:MAG: alpha/beta hydrolase [Pyramidobacter sp.]|nr:alpha/beta hydrolase [Pyramidobacter sp.]
MEKTNGEKGIFGWRAPIDFLRAFGENFFADFPNSYGGSFMKKLWMVFLAGVLLGTVPFDAHYPDQARAAAEESVSRLRYFSQPNGVKGSDTPYGNNTSAGQYVQADDAKIYYETYGAGQPFFVFHGGGVGSPYELGRIIDELRKDFKVIVVSTRGHGRSEIGRNPVSYEQKARDMLAVIRNETDSPVPIFGFSDGAYTAFKVASLYPDAVERIVAVGAGTLKPGYFPSEMKVEDLEKTDKAYMDQLRSMMPEPERLQEFFNAYMSFWNKMEAGKELFGSITCPVLLIAGDEDDHAPVLTVLKAHQMLPNSRLCIVPKAWHTAFLDNYPVTWAAVAQFVHAAPGALVSSKKLEQNN